MKKSVLRLLAVILITTMLITLLAGCRKDPESNFVPPEFVFVPEVVTLSENVQDIRNLTFANDKLYFWSMTYDEETWESTIQIFTMNIDGSNLTELHNYDSGSSPYEDAMGQLYITALQVDKDGNIWVAETGSFYRLNVPDDFDGEEWEVWNFYEDLGTVISIRKLDNTGAEILSLDISSISAGSEWFHVSAFAIDSMGNIYIGANETIFILNNDGVMKYKLELNNWIDRLINMPDGTVAYFGYLEGVDGYSQVLRSIDPVTGAWGDDIEIPSNVWYVYPGGGDYLIIYRDSMNLHGISIETGESVRLLNWLESGVDADNMDNITVLPDGRILCTNQTWDRFTYESTFELYLLTRVPYSDLPERTVITLATPWLDWNLRSPIVQFNRTNPEYRIHVIDYSEFNTDDDWSIARTRLTTDIIAGNIPDILDVSQLPFKQYVARGLLEDLYSFIDKDPRLNRSDFMESVFRAAEMDGALYRMFPSFYINTLIGNPSVVGPGMGWTMNEFRAVLDANPQADMPLGQWLTKETFLNAAVFINIDEYVDWAKGEVHFDTGAFAQLLEFANIFPMNFDHFDWESGEYVDQNELIATGRQIMMEMQLGDFRSLMMYQAVFGGEIAFKGFPTESGNGNSLTIGSSLAITSRSSNKDGAWEFVSTILDREWQRQNVWWGYPTNKAAFDDAVAEAMKEQEETHMIDWGFGAMELKPLTQAEVNLILNLIDNSFGIVSYDEALMNIINEDASDFFNGRISAQDAARRIQNRAGVYVSEQS